MYRWHKRHHEFIDSNVWTTMCVGARGIPRHSPLQRLWVWCLLETACAVFLVSLQRRARRYVGFLDALLTDLIPVGIALVCLKMHMWVQWTLTISLLANAFIVHCGYKWPPPFNPFILLPFATESEVTHDLHHRYGNVNFGGAFFVWDRLLGTLRLPKDEDAKTH
jgi:sterol desaturase/sphingolipid hydroxylase (fatty acid hydroxylase superfamily)